MADYSQTPSALQLGTSVLQVTIWEHNVEINVTELKSFLLLFMCVKPGLSQWGKNKYSYNFNLTEHSSEIWVSNTLVYMFRLKL